MALLSGCIASSTSSSDVRSRRGCCRWPAAGRSLCTVPPPARCRRCVWGHHHRIVDGRTAVHSDQCVSIQACGGVQWVGQADNRTGSAAQRRHQGNGQPSPRDQIANKHTKKKGDDQQPTTTTHRDQHVQHSRIEVWKFFFNSVGLRGKRTKKGRGKAQPKPAPLTTGCDRAW